MNGERKMINCYSFSIHDFCLSLCLLTEALANLLHALTVDA